MTDKVDPDTAVICDACNGSGFSADHYCGKCGGAGGIPPEAEAADEITRLKAEVERLNLLLESAKGQFDRHVEWAAAQHARTLLKARSGGSDG